MLNWKHFLSCLGGYMVIFGGISVALSALTLLIPNAQNIYSTIVVYLFAFCTTFYLARRKILYVTSDHKKK